MKVMIYMVDGFIENVYGGNERDFKNILVDYVSSMQNCTADFDLTEDTDELAEQINWYNAEMSNCSYFTFHDVENT